MKNNNIDLSIISNFELSVIIPLYCNVKKFEETLLYNYRFFARNGIELILLADNKVNNAPMLSLLEKYPLINWKIICTDSITTNITISKCLQICLSEISKKFAIVVSPSSNFYLGFFYQLRILEKRNKIPSSPLSGMDLSTDLSSWERAELSSIVKVLPSKYYYFTVTKLIKNLIDEYPENEYPENKSIIFNWQDKPDMLLIFEKCFKVAPTYWINNNKIFTKKYKIIALVPSFNVESSINLFLRELSPNCDGIILLDDGSDDNTYEIAESEKLLIKMKKQRNGFNDLLNRNILLNVASFFNCDWFFFLDTDEFFDERYCDLYEIASSTDIDVYGFWIINLWNDEKMYRTDLPDLNPYSKDGVWLRWRMFRNKGRMQLPYKRKLHFPTVPYKERLCYSNILVKHFGCMKKQDRQLKYDTYMEADKVKFLNYDYLLDNNPLLEKVENIDIEAVNSKAVKK